MRTRRKGRWLPKQPRLGARMCQGTFFFTEKVDAPAHADRLWQRIRSRERTGKNMRDYQTYIGEICDTLLFPAEAKETMEQDWEKICANAAAKETFLKWLLVYEADGKLDYKEVLKAADTAAKEAGIA